MIRLPVTVKMRQRIAGLCFSIVRKSLEYANCTPSKCVDTSKTRRPEGRLQVVNERGTTTYCEVYTHLETVNQLTKWQ